MRVNAVLPGLIVTPMIEKLEGDPGFKDHFARALKRHSIGRFGQPEDVGRAVKWLLSDEAAFINGAMVRCSRSMAATRHGERRYMADQTWEVSGWTSGAATAGGAIGRKHIHIPGKPPG